MSDKIVTEIVFMFIYRTPHIYENRHLPQFGSDIKDNRLSDMKIKVKNGEYYLEHTLFTNHFSQEVRETLELFYKISEIAPGSYGLLYIHNDEDKKNYNSFCVYKAAKGKVTKLEDVYLSPYIPIVEE